MGMRHAPGHEHEPGWNGKRLLQSGLLGKGLAEVQGAEALVEHAGAAGICCTCTAAASPRNGARPVLAGTTDDCFTSDDSDDFGSSDDSAHCASEDSAHCTSDDSDECSAADAVHDASHCGCGARAGSSSCAVRAKAAAGAVCICPGPAAAG